MSARPFVFVVYAEITAPVVRAQSMPLMEALRASGHTVDAAVFTSPRRLLSPSVWTAHHTALRSVEAAIGRTPYSATHAPRDRGLTRLGDGLASALVQRGDADGVLVCRQPRATLIAVHARGTLKARGHDPRVVLDLRGLRDVEYLLTLGKDEGDLSADEARRLATYRSQEAEAVAAADGVIVVSSAMGQALGARYGIDPSRVAVLANHAREVPFAEDLRGTSRGELGLSGGQLLVAYCGTLAAWQMAEESALLVKALQAFRTDARLLYLTPDAVGARAILERTGLKNALVRSATQEDVARTLAAADYGLLLRRASPVNRVASPVKFGEYLACGVRPILTPQIGDQSQIVMDEGLGLVVSPEEAERAAGQIALDADNPEHLSRAGRDRRRTWASTHISPPRAAERLAAFLETVADN